MTHANFGILYIVATPIGNLMDMTPRAIEVLSKVDVIAAEDTRRAKKLLHHFAIKPPKIISHHKENEKQSSQGILALLEEGLNVALVSDSGMPLISDPGYILVTDVIKLGAKIVPIPGANAALSALSASGMGGKPFVFIGFLPAKKKESELKRLVSYVETLVFYEAPHRVVSTLKMMQLVLGNRQACLGRELTKMHEEFLYGTLQDIEKTLSDRTEIKGEITLVVAGNATVEKMDWLTIEAEVKRKLVDGVSPKTIRDELIHIFGVSKKELYARILKLKAKNN